MRIDFEKKNFREISTLLREYKIRHGPIQRDGNTYFCRLLNNHNQALFSYLVLCDKVRTEMDNFGIFELVNNLK